MGQPPQAPQPPQASPPPPASGGSGGLEPNIAAMLAYLFWIPAILWLVIEPYNKDSFIRFHSFQALFLGLAWIAVMIVSGILSIVPFIGPLLLFFLPLGMLVVVVYCAYKAYNKAKFKLPLIGDFAEKTAGSA